MQFFNIIIVWVLLQGTPYVRDIFNLPLHDSRSLLLDLIILILGFCFFIFNEVTKQRNDRESKGTKFSQIKIESNNTMIEVGRRHKSNFYPSKIIYRDGFTNLCSLIHFDRGILIWILPGIIILLASIINESSQYMYFKQYLVFYILIQYVSWVIERNGANALFCTILYGSMLFLFVQFSFFLLNLIHDGAYQDLIEKNSFPIAMLAMSELSRRLEKKNFYKIFIVIGCISAFIASTKIYFLLLFCLWFINHFKFIRSSSVLAIFVNYILICFPIILPTLIMLVADINIDDMIDLEQRRYFINDNIGSLVSRIYSVQILLIQENFLKMFGNNEDAISDFKFWGYPVHNLYMSLIFAHGYLLLLVFIVYICSIYRFFARHMGLGLILSFTIIYSNDIPPFLSLLFIPYMIIKHNKNSSKLMRKHA